MVQKNVDAIAERPELDLLRSKIEADKELAGTVIQHARAELKNFSIDFPFNTGLHGELTKAMQTQVDYKQNQHAGLSGVQRDLYFVRVNTEVRYPSGVTETSQFLITKSRLPAYLSDGDWTVIAWTAPIASLIRDKPVLTAVTFTAARRPPVIHTVLESAKFGSILPRVTKATYALKGAPPQYVDDEAELYREAAESVALPEAKAEEKYEAAQEFGLGEIIELADTSQNQAMQLPFDSTVLIEGPPGSGKTSIGLMRIPCLIDRQWEELGLDREKDQPFHTVCSVRVLVMNEEMIDYLARLTRHPSIGLGGVSVQTMAEMCRQLCREAGILSGRHTTKESQELLALKLHPKMFSIYSVGFVAWVKQVWEARSATLKSDLTRLDQPAADRIFSGLARWVEALLASTISESAWESPPNLANRIASLFDIEERRIGPIERRERGMSDRELQSLDQRSRENESARQRLRMMRESVLSVCREIFDRPAIVKNVLSSSKFSELQLELESAGLQLEGQKIEWLEQTKGDVQQLSEGDFALSAWIAVNVALVQGVKTKPAFGGISATMTHAVIDEAQDIAVVHAAVIRKLVPGSGTVTLVGDLRQRVSNRGYFKHWDQLNLAPVTRAVFGVNYRQSQPLGEFVRDLHTRLYSEPPLWTASARTLGEKPRLRRSKKRSTLALTVADEVRYWRREIPGATVAVLFHGKWPGSRALTAKVEDLLQDTLTEVHLAVGKGRTEMLRRNDCALVATVGGSKGLEFDAVVVIDPRGIWKSKPSTMTETRKNALYVAVSRARQGLSIVLNDDAARLDLASLSTLELVPDARSK